MAWKKNSLPFFSVEPATWRNYSRRWRPVWWSDVRNPRCSHSCHPNRGRRSSLSLRTQNSRRYYMLTFKVGYLLLQIFFIHSFSSISEMSVSALVDLLRCFKIKLVKKVIQKSLLTVCLMKTITLYLIALHNLQFTWHWTSLVNIKNLFINQMIRVTKE